MAQSPTPPPIESLGDRPFLFYPPIVNIEHNAWRFRKATWSEVLVTNLRTNEDLWIPKRFLGEVSRIEDPEAIVGLNRELEYTGGAVWPCQRRVIEMPAVVGGAPAPSPGEPAQPARIVGIRTEPATDTRILRLIGLVLLIAIGAYFVMAGFLRQGPPRARLVFTTKDQSYLELRSQDDYYAVVSRLGAPSSDRWMSETGEIQYRALGYQARAYTIILMGPDRKSATYIGTVDDNWKPVHAVPFRSGGTSFSMLRELRRF